MAKKYFKLLTQEDIEEVLSAAEIKLTPTFKNHRGETVNSYDTGREFVLCRGEMPRNKELDKIIEVLSPLIGQPTYAPHKVLVFISDFQAWVAEIHYGEYSDEAIKMTNKLKEILSKKSEKYLDDFKNYWESEEENENE